MGGFAISTHLKPAHHVIAAFGGPTRMVKRLAKLGFNKEATDAYRLLREKDKRGTGGIIPQSWHLAILQAAEEDGLDITDRDIIRGRKIGA